MAQATACVFSPNKVPDGYAERASIALVLRPAAFRANAIDVAGLYRLRAGRRAALSEIKAPTVVISGDRDTVVYEEIHRSAWPATSPAPSWSGCSNLGHKPDWIAPELVVGGDRESVAGAATDLQAMASERRSSASPATRMAPNVPISRAGSRTRAELDHDPERWKPVFGLCSNEIPQAG